VKSRRAAALPVCAGVMRTATQHQRGESTRSKKNNIARINMDAAASAMFMALVGISAGFAWDRAWRQARDETPRSVNDGDILASKASIINNERKYPAISAKAISQRFSIAHHGIA